ncbi:TRAFs-binding domain-containing protein [Sphingobium ummariense]|uniref:Uncharacterized protein n=1 Tax=Sphingobium ummariense RL-3 TaxID=1346791 RepID=T0KAP2_9SPHN|nr:TRAFs-binding domain-containing protein [Sphingobium ummariense]EQB30558.1 hypothetical protein M529_19605 [Sphingobium ummariense RL-3]
MIVSGLAQIRGIARAGDTNRAWRMFSGSGLLLSDDPEALSLKGRLLKDRALSGAPAERSILLEEAEGAYLEAARGRRATYPLINAATLAFLNDRPDQARLLARRVLTLLDSGDHEAETRYWLAATAAEAHLLLGDEAASRAALERAMAVAPEAWEDHAATLRQLRQILTRTGLPPTLFDHLRPPPSLYFSGIIGLPEDEAQARRQIGDALDAIRPGAVFGALAAGADILIAELAVERGVELHVVLPTTPDVFRSLSVGAFGGQWMQRFNRLVELAASVEAPHSETDLSDAAVAKGAEIAMGLALRRAKALETQAMALHVGRGSDAPSPSESRWRDRGMPVHTVTLDQSAPRTGRPLPTAVSRAILASVAPFPAVTDSTPPVQQSASGVFLIALDDLGTAMLLADRFLQAAPASGLALEYRTSAPADRIDADDGMAVLLARAAPAGSVCAPWPEAAAMEIRAPQFRFEMAGDVMTAYGEYPVGHYYPTGGAD